MFYFFAFWPARNAVKAINTFATLDKTCEADAVDIAAQRYQHNIGPTRNNGITTDQYLHIVRIC